MKKMSTLFKVDYYKKGIPGIIYDLVRPENEWVFSDSSNVTITRKWDGQATAVINGKLFRRYDAKHGKNIPSGAIPCCGPDPVSGHHPHWLEVTESTRNDQFLWQQWLQQKHLMTDGTYEFCGEKVGNNKENIVGHQFIRHGTETYDVHPLSFDNIKHFLENQNVEGLVFHHIDGRMCKIRKTDFGLIR
jgi:hypothetical protein